MADRAREIAEGLSAIDAERVKFAAFATEHGPFAMPIVGNRHAQRRLSHLLSLTANGRGVLATPMGLAVARVLQEDDECSWCGAEPAPHANREGEKFCSPSHRKQSNAARRVLQEGGENEG